QGRGEAHRQSQRAPSRGHRLESEVGVFPRGASLGMTPTDPEERRAWRTDEEWTRLEARLTAADVDSRARGPQRWPCAAAAAVALLAVGLSMVLRHRNVSVPSAAAPAVRVVATKNGERSIVHLDDSSTVTLAPATTLRITGDSKRREIELDGMADFRV